MRLPILGVSLTAQRFDDAIEAILRAAEARASFRAHFCTVHSLVEATRNPPLAVVFETADMVCTDGMPLVWLARRAGAVAERVAGPDVMLAVCDRGRQIGLRHYFVGGRQGVAPRLVERLRSQFPSLLVAGISTPPFRAMTQEERTDLEAAIRACNANIVWIGLGAPKQELFAAELQAALASVVVLPVGAAFDFHALLVRRAPGWMQRLGLEWLFRLAMEPRRLAGRYLRTNLRFVWLLARDVVQRRRPNARR